MPRKTKKTLTNPTIEALKTMAQVNPPIPQQQTTYPHQIYPISQPTTLNNSINPFLNTSPTPPSLINAAASSTSHLPLPPQWAVVKGANGHFSILDNIPPSGPPQLHPPTNSNEQHEYIEAYIRDQADIDSANNELVTVTVIDQECLRRFAETAYKQAVRTRHFEGNILQWLLSLRGAPGDPGFILNIHDLISTDPGNDLRIGFDGLLHVPPSDQIGVSMFPIGTILDSIQIAPRVTNGENVWLRLNGQPLYQAEFPEIYEALQPPGWPQQTPCFEHPYINLPNMPRTNRGLIRYVLAHSRGEVPPIPPRPPGPLLIHDWAWNKTTDQIVIAHSNDEALYITTIDHDGNEIEDIYTITDFGGAAAIEFDGHWNHNREFVQDPNPTIFWRNSLAGALVAQTPTTPSVVLAPNVKSGVGSISANRGFDYHGMFDHDFGFVVAYVTALREVFYTRRRHVGYWEIPTLLAPRAEPLPDLVHVNRTNDFRMIFTIRSLEGTAVTHVSRPRTQGQGWRDQSMEITSHIISRFMPPAFSYVIGLVDTSRFRTRVQFNYPIIVLDPEARQDFVLRNSINQTITINSVEVDEDDPTIIILNHNELTIHFSVEDFDDIIIPIATLAYTDRSRITTLSTEESIALFPASSDVMEFEMPFTYTIASRYDYNKESITIGAHVECRFFEIRLRVADPAEHIGVGAYVISAFRDAGGNII